MRRLLFACLLGLGLVVLLALAASTVEAQGDDKATATPTLTPTETQAVIHAWQGYVLVEISAATSSTVEAFSRGVDADLELRIREAFSQLAPERSSWPPYALQIGPCNLARTACIVEARFDRMPDAATVADRLGARLGTDRKSVEDSISLTLFAAGGTWEESQAACLEYLTTNAKDWQPEDPMMGGEPGTIEEPRATEPPAPEGEVQG
jgi:hypothetical protein